jgi:hypothetical protein
VAAPFGQALADDQRIVAEAQEIIEAHAVGIAGRGGIERARAGRACRCVDGG